MSENNIEIIEPMPSNDALAYCSKVWDLTDLVFVRKMENIVYSCRRHGRIVFLRLTSPSRRSKTQIESELHFISHLVDANCRVPIVILNAEGQQMMTIKDNQIQFEAVVFACVEGEHPSEDLVVTPGYLKSFGALIATMHQVSHQYEPHSAREQWYEERGIRHALDAAKVSKHTHMREKLDVILKSIHNLEKTPESYGLVHADLGASNLLVTPDGSIGVIDFDDACYHFFAFDLAVVIYSMAYRFRHRQHNHLEKEWLTPLIEGYRSVRPFTQEQMLQIRLLMDFACIRVYFWIEYHQTLNTFHNDSIEHILCMKQWALDRLI